MSDAGLIANKNALPATVPVSQVRDFWTLLKPRVMVLVVFTGVVGLMVAPGTLHPVLAAVTVLCIAVGAGAAGAINMWFDRDIDAVMTRTQHRPLPAGRMAPDDALSFGVFLSLGAVTMLGLAANWMAAGLLAFSILFYVLIYTMLLKRRTAQNIVIGGAAGALPPVIGWAAVTGDVGLGAIVLFAIIFFWTPPHFWALALYSSDDYKRAGVPMLPVVAGRRATKRQMLAYAALLVPLVAVPFVIGLAGWLYLAGALTVGALFVVAAVRVLVADDGGEARTDAGDRAARQMFGFSIVYLFVIFGLLLADGGMALGGTAVTVQ